MCGISAPFALPGQTLLENAIALVTQSFPKVGQIGNLATGHLPATSFMGCHLARTFTFIKSQPLQAGGQLPEGAWPGESEPGSKHAPTVDAKTLLVYNPLVTGSHARGENMDLSSSLPFLQRVVLVTVIAVLGVVAIEFLGRRVLRAIRGAEGIGEERRQRLVTLVGVLRWALYTLAATVALLMLLGNFVDITPLLASAGVFGLAVSLGAQSLITDLIAGLVILAENQYNVGDVVEVGGVAGTVERLTLRATYLRSVEGSLHIVPNGEVRVVSNQTKDWSQALVEVGVAYEEDLDHVLGVLRQVADGMAADPAYAPRLLGPPQVVGPVSLGDWAVTVRVMVRTRPGQHWEVARELRKRILDVCKREGISLPYPRQELLVSRLSLE